MNKLVITALAVAGFVACNGNSLPSAMPDATVVKPVDMTVPPPPPPDLTMEVINPPPEDMTYQYIEAGPLNCGNQTCALGLQCCVTRSGMGATTSCMASCPDGGIDVMCEGPEGCPGHNPCCITLSVKNNNPMTSNVTCGSSRTDCVPVLDLAAMGGTTRLCHVDADCIDNAPGSALRNCCTATLMGISQQLCFDPLYAQLSQGAITCP